MPTTYLRVAVNGYGVIGKRVADAICAQPDMELSGISDVVTDCRIKTAATRGMPIYASSSESLTGMHTAGLPVLGTLDDLIRKVDVVVDCTPKGVAARNLERYRAAGVKAVLQGGEKHDVIGHSFVAQANYATALGRDATRVVSCNTTATVRTLGALKNAGLLKKARGVLIRRATDPWEADHSEIMNEVVPEGRVPSHQEPDAKTVLPDLDVVTMAAKAAHMQCDLHYWIVELTRPVGRDDVLAAFGAAPRIAFVNMAGRPRGDLWEVALWADVLNVKGREAFYTYQVFNEAIVVPESIDAIRALTGIVTEARKSIALTDWALGMRRESSRHQRRLRRATCRSKLVH